MAKKSSFFWPSFAMQSAMLAVESQQVVMMRLAKLAMGGPDTQRESKLMVSEKLNALTESGQVMMMAALGGSQDLGADKVMRLYRRKVRANRRRLAGV